MSLNMPSSLLVKLAPHSERGSRQEHKYGLLFLLMDIQEAQYIPPIPGKNCLNVERVEALGNALVVANTIGFYFVNKVSKHCTIHIYPALVSGALISLHQKMHSFPAITSLPSPSCRMLQIHPFLERERHVHHFSDEVLWSLLGGNKMLGVVVVRVSTLSPIHEGAFLTSLKAPIITECSRVRIRLM